METDVEKVKELLAFTEEEILLQIGKDITGTAVRGHTRGDLIRKARAWVESSTETWQAAICRHPNIRKLMSLSPTDDRKVELVVTVSDILSTILIGIPTVTIAVLLVRTGLDSFCKGYRCDATE